MEIKYSRSFLISLVLLHMAVAFSVCATTIPVVAKILVLILVSLSLIYYWARDVLRKLPNSITGISLDRDGMSISTRDGRIFSAQLEKNTFVYPYFIVLRVVPDGHRLAISRLIFPDTLDEGSFRELSVRLRFV